VTTAAYRLVIADRLDDLMGKLADATDPGAVAAAAEEARRRVLAVEVPEHLGTAITGRYHALGDNQLERPGEPVAVRSSATAEDLAYASFAGQQDTYLNVVGAAALLDAVRRCWASLWTDRAVSYRNATIDHRSVTLAVVVQRMIDATVSAMFTRIRLPVPTKPSSTPARLGEAVVSGAVNLDHFVEHPRPQHCHRRLGDKRMMITSRPRRHRASRADQRGPKHASMTSRCCSLLIWSSGPAAVRTSGHRMGAGLGGSFWLTQARPITTLIRFTHRSTRPSGLHVPELGAGLTDRSLQWALRLSG
jgi:pyruvate,water dikinase